MSFAPYQVDYTSKNASKTFGFSKKRVSFKFGIANNEAVAQGLTGAHCRGSEHEIIFIWSLNSGKRQILADGKDVHYSESGQNGWTVDQVFQHQFQMRIPNFSAPFRCHLITQPANRDVPSIHPFDLRLNGISFFAFSKIFQLGTPQMISRPLKGGGGGSGGGRSRNVDPDDDPYLTPEERKAIAAAKLASIRDMREREAMHTGSIQSAPPVMNRDEGNLINLLDDPGPPAPGPPGQYVSSMTMDTTFVGGSPASALPPFGQQPYGNYSLGGQPLPHQPQQSLYGQPSYDNGFGQTSPQSQPTNQFADQYQRPPPSNQFAAQYQQPPASNQFADQYQQPPASNQFADQYQQPPASNQFADQYQQPPAPQGYYGYGQPPPQQQQQSYPGFASPPPNNMLSPMGQSVASYGSAPSFAQPPRPPPSNQYQQPPPPQQQQYQGYPQY